MLTGSLAEAGTTTLSNSCPGVPHQPLFSRRSSKLRLVFNHLSAFPECTRLVSSFLWEFCGEDEERICSDDLSVAAIFVSGSASQNNTMVVYSVNNAFHRWKDATWQLLNQLLLPSIGRFIS